MNFCLFLAFAECDADAVARSASSAPGVLRALAHTASQARDPFIDDGAPPPLAVQLYFAELGALESALPALAGLPPSVHEAMAVRRYAVPEPGLRGEPWCTYLVRYEGPAEDPAAWHAHYLEGHPPLMRRLPGLRELEIYAALEWSGTLPGTRVRSLQRNKVAFDSPAALSAALESPVRSEMRADYGSLPRFAGAVTHFPMLTRCTRGSRDPS